MRQALVLGQICAVCGISFGMNQSTWDKYDSQKNIVTKLVVEGHGLAAEDLQQWSEEQRQKIERIDKSEALKSDLLKRVNKIVAEYQCLVDYGLTLDQYGKLFDILLSIYPSNSETLKDKMSLAREAVRPGLYNTAANLISYVVPSDGKWKQLDDFLQGVDKKNSMARLAQKIEVLQKNVEILSGDRENQQLLRYETEALSNLVARVQLVKSGLNSSFALLPVEIKSSVVGAVLKAVEEKYRSHPINSFVKELLANSDNSDLEVFIKEASPEDREKLSLGLDALMLLINAELGKQLNTNVPCSFLSVVTEYEKGKFRLVDSNIECSRTFERGGWLKFCGAGLDAYFGFDKATNQEWTGCRLNIGYTPLFKDKTYCAIDLIQNVFANFVCKVIHFDPKDQSVFLCGDGEGNRAFCVVLNEKFIFRGDLLSNLRIGDIEQKHNVYLEAQVDSGTFANEQKKVDLKNPGMTFGQACLAFMNGKLDGEVTPRKLTYTIQENSPPISMAMGDTRTPQKKTPSSPVRQKKFESPSTQKVVKATQNGGGGKDASAKNATPRTSPNGKKSPGKTNPTNGASPRKPNSQKSPSSKNGAPKSPSKGK